MRFSNRHWVVAPPVPASVLAEFPELHPLLVQLLVQRGVQNQTAIDEFLHPDWTAHVHDPFLFRNMDKAVSRLIDALRAGELIAIYGDYDADGVSASAVLAETFKVLGGRWEVYIPDRLSEGYGMNLAAVESIAKRGAKVLITVDCGSSNVSEVARARELGLDVIITDHHHEPREVPAAFAVINPSFSDAGYPFQSLSAGGVAFKVVQALLQRTHSGADLGKPLPEGWEKWLLDFVTISTIADMVPLVGENRTLVSYGLTVLRKTRHVGVRELVMSSRLNLSAVSASDIAFILGPRVNAAGRLNHASGAFNLLMAETTEDARTLAQALGRTNTDRQRLTLEVYKACLEQIGEQPAGPIIFAGDPEWSPGILGLVAGRLVQHYGKPAIVYGSIGEEVVGSGRSVPALNIIESLDEVRDALVRYGGHGQACGFTLKSRGGRAAFEKTLTAVIEKRLAGKSARLELAVDAQLPIESVDWPLLETLQSLEPHGIGNPKPRFLAEGVEIVSIERVGGDQQHLRLSVVDGDHIVRKMIGFSFGTHGDGLTVGETIDVIYEAGVHTWNGNREIELKMVDAKHSHEPL